MTAIQATERNEMKEVEELAKAICIKFYFYHFDRQPEVSDAWVSFEEEAKAMVKRGETAKDYDPAE